MASVGVDFGTTNSSLVSYNKDTEQFEFIGSENRTEPEPVPSVVWYTDNKIIVGKEAKNNFNKYCETPGHHMEKSIKMKLGTTEKVSIFGQLTEPPTIACQIIKKLKTIAINNKAELAGVSLDKAVFTIPVGFSGRQRVALRKAAEEAGIIVDTFIHEPLAALIGYLYTEYDRNKISQLNENYVLVFDWGGGTLDITAVKIEQDKMFEVGTSELTGYAGDRFDNDLVLHIKNRVKDRYSNQFSSDQIDLAFDERIDRLTSNAEQCKIDLSSVEDTVLYVENFLYDPNTGKTYDIDEKIQRSDFEACIRSHIDNAIGCVDKALRNANISSEQIAFVLMTGGSSYIPAVRTAIEDKFGSRVRTAKNPDMVIAQGAAVVSEMKWSPYLSKDIMIELSDGSYWPVFPKGMPLVREEMNENSQVFTCVDTRDKEAKVIIAEGTQPDTKDKNMAVFSIPVNHETGFRYPDEVSVNFKIDNNIVLYVSGYGKLARKRKTIEVHNICFGVEMK